jgi:signal transduction histidine kinase
LRTTCTARAAAAEARRRQGSEERLRIARDLHDVLGHHISLINVQAGVALYLMDDDPEQARSALTAIKQSSRDLLREMRSTLGVLRGVDEEPPHDPVAGLSRLDDLVEATRAAGLPVTVEIGGEPRELPPSVDTAAYRIIQEALTNARKHAGPAQASVLLTYTEDGITMRIDDDGTGPAGTTGGGDGIPGMRERAAALGGTLTAGPRPGGGFRVDAHLLTTGGDR